MFARFSAYTKELILLISLPAIGLATLYLLTYAFWLALLAGAALLHKQGLLVLPLFYTLVPHSLWSWAGLMPPATLSAGKLLTLPAGMSVWPPGTLPFLHTAGLRAIMVCWPYALGFAALTLYLGYRYQERWVEITTTLDRHAYAPPYLDPTWRELVRRANLLQATPRLRLWENAAPNAFASGLSAKTYQVTITTGLLKTLTADEVRAVLGHELGHIKRGDVRLMTLCYVYGDLYARLARYFWRLIGDSAGGEQTRYNRLFFSIPFLIPVALIFSIGAGMTTIVRLMLVRGRELAADRFSARLTAAPQMLDSALRKIEAVRAPPPKQRLLRDSVIYRPRQGFWERLLATHPTLEIRLKHLKR